jgi:hypothetical protein
MKFKYIVVKRGEKEDLFLFSNDIEHKQFYKTILDIDFDPYGFNNIYPNRGYGNNDPQYQDPRNRLVSAGFFADGVCYGASESLKISSRNEVDTALFKQCYGDVFNKPTIKKAANKNANKTNR